MGAAIAQGASNSKTNPALVFYAGGEAGYLADLASLDFAVYDVSTPANRVAPVSVVARTPVDLDDDRVGLGRYVPPFTIGSMAAAGMYEIRYFWKFDEDDDESTCRKDFEVVAGGVGGFSLGPCYAFLADLREEGVLSAQVSDARLQVTLVLASRYVQEVCGRVFEARYMKPRFDGNDSRALLLNDPIVALERLGIDTEPGGIGDLEVDQNLVRVFNRHLSQGLLSPDDRDDPRLVFVHNNDDLFGVSRYRSIGVSLTSLIFPSGVQNIQAIGVYGYTEPDGSPWGQTPALIRHVTKLLALREMIKMTNIDCREDFSQRWRIKDIKTRDQEVMLADPRSWNIGSFAGTGDPEIDSILIMYTRPPTLGSA